MRNMSLARPVVLLGILTAVVMVAFASPALAADGWTITQVTDTGLNESTPLISGDLVAWSAYDGNDTEIFIWKMGVSSPVQLTNNDMEDSLTDIDGDRIVWSSSIPWTWEVEWPDSTVYTWKYGEAAPTLVSPESGGVYCSPRVSGDRVVWMGRPQGDWSWDVWTWSADGSGSRVVSSPWYPDLGPDVSGDRVAWIVDAGYYSREDIYTWKAGDPEPTPLAATSGAEWEMAIDGDRIAWVVYSDYNTPTALFTWSESDGGPTQVNTEGWGVDEIRVSGDRLVWTGHRDIDGYGYAEVFTWQVGDASPTRVTNDGRYDYMPQVDGDRIAWTSQFHIFGPDTFLVESDIYTWAAGDAAPTCLHDELPAEDILPAYPSAQVSGNRVVWSAWDGTDAEVYLAELVPAAPEVVLSTHSLDFGTVEIGASATTTLTVSNPGGATLEADLVIGSAAVSGPAHISVQPGTALEVVLTFAPTAECPDVASELWFATNVATLPEGMAGPVSISGVGVSRYVSSGALQPINPDGTSVFKAGSTIPVKILLADRSGAAFTGATVEVYVTHSSDEIGGSVFEAESVCAADEGNVMREVDPGSYMFNLSSKGLAPGTYVLLIVYPDGTSTSVAFGLK